MHRICVIQQALVFFYHRNHTIENFAHKLMHKEKEKINKRAKTYDFRAVGSEPKQNRKQGCEKF